MGVQGFAEGLRNGFDMMDRYQNRQDQQKYRDDLLGLRQGYLDQQKLNSDRNFQHTTDRDKVADDHFKQSLESQNKDRAGQAESRNLQNQLARMGIEEKRKQVAQDDWKNKWEAPTAMAYEAATNGDFAPLDALEQQGAFDSDVGQHYHPKNIVSPEYAQKSADVATRLQKLANSQLPVDSPEFVAATHDPKFLENINYMLQGELDNHVGKADLNGKEIKNQQISQIMMDPKTHNLVFGYDTTYADGSKGHDTKYGEDGHPKSYKWTDLAGPLIKRAALSNQLIASPQAFAQATHLIPGADPKAMNQAQAAENKAYVSALGRATDPEARAAVQQAHAESTQKIRDMYGAKGSGKPGSYREWIGRGKEKDYGKLAFINQQKPEVVKRLADLYRRDPDAALAAFDDGYSKWRKDRESKKGGGRSSAVPPRPESRNVPAHHSPQSKSPQPDNRPPSSLREVIESYNKANGLSNRTIPDNAPIRKIGPAVKDGAEGLIDLFKIIDQKDIGNNNV
jgi:hypothetical protein